VAGSARTPLTCADTAPRARQATNCAALGLRVPTPVQRACVPAVLRGRDCIGIAHTGSGKTAAFALPLLQRLAADPYGVFALVLTPTRELAAQIAEQFRALSAGFALRVCVCVGGEEACRQAAALARKPHVVVATPGRLRDHLESHEGAREALSRVACLVLDEADRLLEPSFEPELAVVLPALPASRQTLLFSATLTPAVAALQRLTGAAAFRFAAYEDLTLPSSLAQQLLLVPAKVKEVYLAYLLDAGRLGAQGVRSALVFAGSVRATQLLSEMLRELGAAPAVLHSAMAQKARAASLQRFRAGAATLLVATDVASRGLDIPTVDLVINFDVPAAPADYVHRCGRTARAGRGGRALTFVTQYDVARVTAIEAHTGQQLVPLALPEQEVLRGMTAVLAARRVATMQLAQPGGFDEKLSAQRKARAAGNARRAAGIAAAAE
jgi:ATP-dependent RNA helicase DDX49/DBP8